MIRSRGEFQLRMGLTPCREPGMLGGGQPILLNVTVSIIPLPAEVAR